MVGEIGGIVPEVIDQSRILWELYKDKDVPKWMKVIPLASVGAALFLFRKKNDWFPNSSLDNLSLAGGAIVVGYEIFKALAPEEALGRAKAKMASGRKKEEDGKVAQQPGQQNEHSSWGVQP